MESLRKKYKDLLQINKSWEAAEEKRKINENPDTILELDQAEKEFDERLEEVEKSIEKMKNKRLFARLTAALKSHSTGA